MMAHQQKTIIRILRVNHAGEYGAIRIYGAQILVARILYKDLVPVLTRMRDEEIVHCKIFRAAMPSRQARPCRTLWLWSWGGFLLGLVAGLLGRNAVMVCTEAVEDAVHRHMNEQIAFLDGKDKDLKLQIETIKVEELEHLDFAKAHVRNSRLTRAGHSLIYFITEALIWLSTQGALTLMKRDLDVKD